VTGPILLASGNRNKYIEMSEFLEPGCISLLFGPDVLGFELEIEEDGDTYAGNALKKARIWAEKTGIPSLADDSGLEVKALGWAPGIGSARVAADDAGRIRWLLGRMGNTSDRTARFVACLALFYPQDGKCLLTQGYCWGRIANEPVGDEGFGYDPVFIPRGYEETFASLGRRAKSRISHRSIAAISLRRMLQDRFCDRMCTRAR
jgi:XTP/dITP diphosphohydrolase